MFFQSEFNQMHTTLITSNHHLLLLFRDDTWGHPKPSNLANQVVLSVSSMHAADVLLPTRTPRLTVSVGLLAVGQETMHLLRISLHHKRPEVSVNNCQEVESIP